MFAKVDTLFKRGTVRSNYPLMPSDSQVAPLFFTRGSEKRVMEEWKDIPGYEGKYKVSSFGSVFSLKRKCNYNRTRNGGPVAKSKDKDGYELVCLWSNSKQSTLKVHALVLLAFVGDRPHNLVVDHINEDKADNRLSNLRYLSHRENCVRSKRKDSSLPTGVSVSKKRFRAMIRWCGKKHHIGIFSTEEEAGRAYELALKHGPEEAKDMISARCLL